MGYTVRIPARRGLERVRTVGRARNPGRRRATVLLAATLLGGALTGCARGPEPLVQREVAAPATVDPAKPCVRQASAAPAEQPGATRTPVRAALVGGVIRVSGGTDVTLAALSRTVRNPSALKQTAPGEWLLGASLEVLPGASVRLAAPDVTWLKVRSEAGSFATVKALGGGLALDGVCVTGWDPGARRADTDQTDGRAFILARDGARFTVDGSEIRYLGYSTVESYGLAWRTGSTGHIRHSVVSHLHFGFYSYQTTGLVVADNEFHDNTLYGIDPHTGSNKLVIERNVVHDNGKHGIILAEDCTDGVIRDNVVYRNAHHGIVLYQRSDRNVVEGNESFLNAAQGINVNEAADNTVRNNRVYANGESGIGLGATASRNLVQGNQVRANKQDGIRLVSEASEIKVRDNVIGENARYGVYIDGGGPFDISANSIFASRVGVLLKNSDQRLGENRIRDNADGDLVTR
jgi:parallel beta-helix repeat protein